MLATLSKLPCMLSTPCAPPRAPQTCEAAAGANPAKRRELEDSSRKLGALLWRLNAGEASASVTSKLLQVGAAPRSAEQLCVCEGGILACPTEECPKGRGPGLSPSVVSKLLQVGVSSGQRGGARDGCRGCGTPALRSGAGASAAAAAAHEAMYLYSLSSIPAHAPSPSLQLCAALDAGDYAMATHVQVRGHKRQIISVRFLVCERSPALCLPFVGLRNAPDEMLLTANQEPASGLHTSNVSPTAWYREGTWHPHSTSTH